MSWRDLTIKRVASLALAVATGVAAFLIYLESTLGGFCIAVLALVLAAGGVLDRRVSGGFASDDYDGRKATLRGVAVRQGRAMTRREEGEISGAPPSGSA